MTSEEGGDKDVLLGCSHVAEVQQPKESNGHGGGRNQERDKAGPTHRRGQGEKAATDPKKEAAAAESGTSP